MITLTKSLFTWKTAGILTGVKLATLVVVVGLRADAAAISFVVGIRVPAAPVDEDAEDHAVLVQLVGEVGGGALTQSSSELREGERAGALLIKRVKKGVDQ